MKNNFLKSIILAMAIMIVIISGCSSNVFPKAVNSQNNSIIDVVEYEYFDEFPTLMKPDYIKGVSFDKRTEKSDNDGMYYQYIYKVNSTVSRTEAMREYYQSVKDVKTDENSALRVHDGDDEDPFFSGTISNGDGTYDEYIVGIDYDNYNKFYVTILIDYSEGNNTSNSTSLTSSAPFTINGKWTATETYDSNAKTIEGSRNPVPYGDVWISFKADGTYEWYSQGLIVTGDYREFEDTFLLQYNGELLGIASDLSNNELLLNIIKNGKSTNMSYILEKN